MKTLLVQGGLLASFGKYCGILLRPDVRVFLAETVDESLALHREKKADLIVADMDMPGGGDKLCLAIKGDDSLKKAHIVLACGGSDEDMKRCYLAGANAFVEKPVEPEKLYRAVCNALDVPERKGLRVLVKVTVHGRFKREPFYCLSKDISLSGILLETEKALAKGDEITCSFFLPNTDRIDAIGLVARVNAVSNSQSFNFGVEFASLSPGSVEAIGGFVRKASALTEDEIAAITIEAIRQFVTKKEP